MKAAVLDRLVAERAAKRPVALVTDLESGDQTLVYPTDVDGETSLSSDLIETARKALVDDRCITVETAGRRAFIQTHNPPLRLVIVGAVHIARPLIAMATLAGYAVTVIDPRRAWSSEQRFPDIKVMQDWPDEAMDALEPDQRTAIVALTHDPKLDDPALSTALRSPAFYVGALGSRRTHGKRRERLRSAGLADGEIDRIHGPIGLDIGALSPAEIALSIMAEITRVRRKGE